MDPRLRFEHELDESQLKWILLEARAGRDDGYHVIRNYFGSQPLVPRAGGFFRIDVPKEQRAQVWNMIKSYTVLGALGTMSSTPTYDNVEAYESKFYSPDPNKVPVFVHTKNADDFKDRQRVANNLGVLGFPVNNTTTLDSDYLSSKEVDENKLAKKGAPPEQLTQAELEEIVNNPNLEQVHNGFDVAYSYRGIYPEPKRSGGHFSFEIHQDDAGALFDELKKATKIGVLGTLISIPTEPRNTAFAERTGNNPEIYRIFIQTYDATDEDDKMRIVNNLEQLGVEVDLDDYKTSQETDYDREMFGNQ